ncbi:hypothetical protein ACQEVF_40470 [Nonomuraea polychroma]|uniref:hypothetical protein n=1 Tax=Nonomuraea polychroma TaxID=46176 RepID=UPI003D8A69B6
MIWYMTDYDWKDLPRDGLDEAKRDMRASSAAGEAVGITTRLPAHRTNRGRRPAVSTLVPRAVRRPWA